MPTADETLYRLVLTHVGANGRVRVSMGTNLSFETALEIAKVFGQFLDILARTLSNGKVTIRTEVAGGFRIMYFLVDSSMKFNNFRSFIIANISDMSVPDVTQQRLGM